MSGSSPAPPQGAADTTAGERQVTPASAPGPAAGQVAFAARRWHTLSLSLSGRTIQASVDGRQVASVTSSAFTSGIPGIEVGGWYRAYFSNLAVTQIGRASCRERV